VVSLLQRLLDLLKNFEAGPRTSPDALRDALGAIAASAIQEDPSQAVIPPGDWPEMVVEAIEAGARQAAALNLAGLRLHVLSEELPLATPAGQVTDGATARFGPFVDGMGRVFRVNTYESQAFLAVVFRPNFVPAGTVLMIPLDSTSDDGANQEWTLPPGSVWIRSHLLAAGVADFAGLRISGGTLKFTGAVLREGNQLIVPDFAPWTLSVAPEQPRGAVPGGSDADALTIALPERLIVPSNGPPAVIGDSSIAGFGSDLAFTPAAAAPFPGGGLLSFPLTASTSDWSIARNRAEAAQFAGTAQVLSPRWVLPLSDLGPGSIHEAPHGGSLVVRLGGEVRSLLAGQNGPPFTWFDSTLTVNGRRLELDGLQVAPGGREKIELWTKATSIFVFAQESIARLLFRSEVGGEDAVAVLGGICRSRPTVSLSISRGASISSGSSRARPDSCSRASPDAISCGGRPASHSRTSTSSSILLGNAR